MKKETYQNQVSQLQNQLAIAKAELEYFNFLFDVVDLYENAAHFIVQDRKVPANMSAEEKQGCEKHLEKIKKLEQKIYA